MIVSSPDVADAMQRLVDVMHAHPGLPAAEVHIDPAGHVDLAIADRYPDIAAAAVAAWAAVLHSRPHPACDDGPPVADAWLGAHHVTVHTATVVAA